MINIKFVKGLLLPILTLIAATSMWAKETIIRHPQPSEPLAQRWEWAFHQADSKDKFWIGYSMDRLMNEDSFIGSFHYPPEDEEISLQELIYGPEAAPDQPVLSEDEELRKAAEKALADIHDRDIAGEQVVKEVAILFRINPGSSSGSGIEELHISNLSLSVDLEFLPLYWLGRAENLPSITLLRKIFENESSVNVKEELVTAVGIHEASTPVFDFLKQVVNSKEDEEVRESAVFWTVHQNSPEGLDFLIATAKNDRSEKIREEAVFAISQVELPEATSALISLAKNSRDQEVQEEAIFWLGQKASKQAEIALEDFAYNHEDYELQKSAIFALSQLSDEAGVPKLIQIAKTHPHPKIRKEAIFWLSQSDDHRALETLIEIVQQ